MINVQVMIYEINLNSQYSQGCPNFCSECIETGECTTCVAGAELESGACSCESGYYVVGEGSCGSKSLIV